MSELWNLVSPFVWGWPGVVPVVAAWLVIGFVVWLFGLDNPRERL